MATTDVEDEDECVIISADDNNITLIEEETGNLFQDTFSGDKADEEWFQPHLEALKVEPSFQQILGITLQICFNDRRNAKFWVKLSGINAKALYNIRANKRCMSYTCYNKWKGPLPPRNTHALSIHWATGHHVCPMGLIYCGVILGSTPRIPSLYAKLAKRAFHWTRYATAASSRLQLDKKSSYVYTQRYKCINQFNTHCYRRVALTTVKSIEISTQRIVTTLKKRTSTCMQSTPSIYEVKVNEILVTQNLQLVMIPAMHIKNETETDHIPVTFVNLSNVPVQLAKHIPVGSCNVRYNEEVWSLNMGWYVQVFVYIQLLYVHVAWQYMFSCVLLDRCVATVVCIYVQVLTCYR